MDKQQSDHIENRFRQAAENFPAPHPNEEAWEKMNAMLDKDPDRKKPLIWVWPLALLFGLFIGAAGLYHYLYSKPVHKTPVVARNNQTPAANRQTPEAYKNEPAVSGIPAEHAVSQQVKKAKITDIADKAYPLTKRETLQPARTGKAGSAGKITLPDQRPDSYAYHKSKVRLSTEKTVADIPAAGYNQDDAVLLPAYKLPPLQQERYELRGRMRDSALNGTNRPVALRDSLQKASSAVKIKLDEAKPARFYFIAAVGKNATSLQKFDTRNTGTVWGGEVGYHLNSFISIQGGLYAGRKIYFAGPEDYTPKQGSYLDSVKILKVDANCFIFDLPLSVRLDILHNKRHALYALTGLSSFIMNSEDYNYHYNTSSGWYRKSEMKYKGNVDLFSSANFAVGYEHKIFKTFYIQAEPYMKLPISGIGEGKVKLYSLGVQLGLKYQPFKK